MKLFGKRKAGREEPCAGMFIDLPTQEIVKKAGIDIGKASVIGTRSSQQDTIFGYQSKNRALAIVCDGMGGLNGGEIASQAAAESFIYAWIEQKENPDIPAFLQAEARKADIEVFLKENEDGERIQAGTTLVAAMVNGDELYWLSVGDSKIYMIRENQITALCRAHNYRMELDMLLQKGELTQEEYAAEEYQAEALTSYIGMGNVTLMDFSEQAFQLIDGDIVLLASDGLYRSLSEKAILEVVEENKKDMQRAADALTVYALQGRKVQDNTSVVLLRYCGMDGEE